MVVINSVWQINPLRNDWDILDLDFCNKYHATNFIQDFADYTAQEIFYDIAKLVAMLAKDITNFYDSENYDCKRCWDIYLTTNNKFESALLSKNPPNFMETFLIFQEFGDNYEISNLSKFKKEYNFYLETLNELMFAFSFFKDTAVYSPGYFYSDMYFIFLINYLFKEVVTILHLDNVLIKNNRR